MKIISIEGNIGSGKSTFVQYLKNHFSDEVCFLDEPVDIWNTIVDKDNVNIIENYYKDQKKYAFSFQMMAYISRLSLLKRAIESESYKYIITERSLNTDREVFCKMLYDDKLIEEIEYNIYIKWFDEFKPNVETQYIYLRCEPLIAEKRVIERSRKGETIPLEYLEKCHQYHEQWLNKENTVYLNSNEHKENIYPSWLTQMKDIIV